MTADRAAEHAKYYAKNRFRRLIKRVAEGGPLRMFPREGSNDCAVDLERNMRVGNALHLFDLRKEKGNG